MPQHEPPRSSIPSRLPTSGSSGTPYIIASALLVVVIVVVLWFKFRKTDAPVQPQVINSVASVTTTAPPPAFDLPPPPEIDSGTDNDGGVKRVATGPGNTMCAGPCRNQETPALTSAVRGAAGAARGCYERALRNNSMIQGRLKVALRVSPTGSVCSASIAEDSLHSSEVSSCVLGLFRGRTFPPPAGGSCADLVAPMSFTPQEGKK